MTEEQQSLSAQKHGIYYEQRRASVNDVLASAVALPAPAPAERQTTQNTLIELIQNLMQVLLFFLIFSSLIGRFEIRQSSMEPTFHEGQRVMVSQVGSFWLHHFANSVQASGDNEQGMLGLERGQVVVFFDNAELTGDALIKRLIGVPGDTIEIRDGEVWINDEPLVEPYVNEAFTECSIYCGPMTIGPDEFFFMGDNRGISRDSRTFGTIPADQIVGRVIVRFWPLEKFVLYL